MDKHKIALHILSVAALIFLLIFLYFVYGEISYRIMSHTIRVEAQETEQTLADHIEHLGEHADRLEYIQSLIAYLEYLQENLEENEPPSLVLIQREAVGNDDIVAYISLPGTNISHAVLQHTDNDFYLYHDMYGNPNPHGAIFLHFANNPDFSDKNTVIFGHNMRSRTMFHDLRHFADSEFFNQNRYINIITVNNHLTYEIFAAFTTHIEFNYLQVQFREGEFESLIEELKYRNYHHSDIIVGIDDYILLLSTCTNVDLDTRYVVAARLITSQLVPV